MRQKYVNTGIDNSGLVTRNCPEDTAQFLCKCHPVHVTSHSSLLVYVGGKVESCFVAADFIKMLHVFSWKPYYWIPKANFSFRTLCERNKPLDVYWKSKAILYEKNFIRYSTLEFSENGTKGESVCTRVNAWERESLRPLGCMSKHWTVHSNVFKCLENTLIWPSGAYLRSTGSFRIVNYQLMVFKTASSLWYRAGEPCVLCVLHAESLINTRALGTAVWYAVDGSQVNHCPMPGTNLSDYVLGIFASK